jgi:integrase
MNKVMFELKDQHAPVRSSIRLIYYCTDGKLLYYTGESIPPSFWPDKFSKGTSAVLRRIESHIVELEDSFKIRNESLTKAKLKASLDKLLRKVVSQESGKIFDLMTRVIDQMQQGKILTPQEKKYSPGSIKTFRFTVEFLKRFRPTMSASSVTIDTYNDFKVWCQDQDYSTNYIGTQIKNWKRLGQLATDNPVFAQRTFKKIQEDAVDIYLSEEEIKAIFDQPYKDGKRAWSRDWFVLACYVGLRVSDLRLLQNRNYSKGFITIANEKTDVKVVIPANSIVKKIMARYKGFPPYVHESEINEHIKMIARAAGIDDQVLHIITKGGKRKDSYLKKWEMVSLHTARRTLITNLQKNSVHDSIVMKLTGIKSAATLKRYNKLTADEAGKIAAELDFFKK